MAAETGTLFWLRVILDHPDLDPTETLLLVALADHVDAEDRCFVGIQRLASAARVSYATGKRRLAELEAKGFITRKRRHRDDGGLSVYDYRLERDVLTPRAQSEPTLGSPRRAHPRAHPDAPAEVPRSNYTSNAPRQDFRKATYPEHYVPDRTPGEPMPPELRNWREQ